MPKFFLISRCGSEPVDSRAQEFTSLKAAHEEAGFVARAMVSGLLRRSEILDGRTIEILDASGGTVATMRLADQIRLAEDIPLG